MSDFGTELARWMQASGMGVRALHRRSGYSAAYISQLRSGQRNPSPRVAQDLDDALEAGGALAASVPPAGTAVAARQHGRDGEDVTTVLSRVRKLTGSRLDPEVIGCFRGSVCQAVEQYETLEHGRLRPLLLRQRAWAGTLLGECGHPGQLQQACGIAATISGLLGYLAVGRADFPLARAYLLESFHLADFAQDTGLQAWTRGLQSFCEYYAGRYDESLRLAADGLRYAASGPQSVRLAVNGVARARGKLGDAQGVHRAVGEAYDLMAGNGAPGGIPSSITLGCYSQAQVAGNAATAYVSLGMPEQAGHYVGLAMPDINKSGSPWSRSLVMIDLAASLIRSADADLERACVLVTEALGISAGRPIVSVRQRAAEFLSDATARWGHTARTQAVRDAARTG